MDVRNPSLQFLTVDFVDADILDGGCGLSKSMYMTTIKPGPAFGSSFFLLSPFHKLIPFLLP